MVINFIKLSTSLSIKSSTRFLLSVEMFLCPPHMYIMLHTYAYINGHVHLFQKNPAHFSLSLEKITCGCQTDAYFLRSSL